MPSSHERFMEAKAALEQQIGSIPALAAQRHVEIRIVPGRNSLTRIVMRCTLEVVDRPKQGGSAQPF